ncbi:MAG: NAD+ synthase [Kiritimatiellia bacterium]
MDTFRIALLQLNTTVGALGSNREKIVKFAGSALEKGAQLALFPEMTLTGYPPEDLILKPHFIRAAEAELQRLCAELPRELICVVGCPVQGPARPLNAAVVLHRGKILATYAKQQLPNYGVFDERRIFEPGERPMCLQIGGVRIGVHICEDSWIHASPDLRILSTLNLTGLMNLSASPFHRGKLPERERILHQTSSDVKAPLVYCNLVGGQDELVFDGGSLVISPNGEHLCRAARFREDSLLVDLPVPADNDPSPSPLHDQVDWVVIDRDRPPNPPPLISPPPLAPVMSDLEEIYEALRLGLRDYTDKNGFNEVLVAISGGIDSALVAALAVDALGADRVTGISLPTCFSSEGTRTDATRLAENLKIDMPMLPIQDLVDRFLDLLKPQWPDRGEDVTEENLQARIRGTLVMALSNKFGRLVVATGNKSEMATGYATLYGDMCGGYALIKDVPKTVVFDLCRWSNEQQGCDRIPQSLIDRPPSAELRADQQDSDSLPPYDILDAILTRYIEQDQGRDEIVAEGFDAELVTRVIRLVDGNEYKRRQSPPGVKITPKAFGRDRRMPITNHFKPTPPAPPST